MFPLPLHLYFEGLAFVTSVLMWRWLKDSGLRWFVPFLLFIVIAETAGRIISKEFHQPNAWLFNLVVPAEYLFYTFVFQYHYTLKTNKTIAKWFFIFFTIYAFIILTFINGLYTFYSTFLLIGSFAMIVFSLMYFAEQYMNEEETSILERPLFWLVSGIFLFNTGEFYYNLLSGYVVENKLDPSLAIFKSINGKLVLVLYTSFIIGFICQRITRVPKSI